MEVKKLDNMIKGWFVGDFEPSVLRTREFEVACKHYKAGEVEERHVHRIASEVTLIVTGEVAMNGRRYSRGDIIRLDPGESADFQVMIDTITVVVKRPSAAGDKYPV